MSTRVARCVCGLLAGLALLLIGTGMAELLGDASDEARYTVLASELKDGNDNAAGRDEAQDVADLPAGAAAWINVSGTGIDYPVAQASEGEPSFYLTHDLWGNRSSSGCPFLDWRCSADGRQAIVYAHRIGTTGKQFTPIAGTWQQSEFDAVGPLTWTTQKGASKLQPLCALKVDMGYQTIQSFDAQGEDELRSWLSGLVSNSSARTSDTNGLIRSAKRAITLVTCASSQSGQRDRTLLVFVC